MKLISWFISLFKKASSKPVIVVPVVDPVIAPENLIQEYIVSKNLVTIMIQINGRGWGKLLVPRDESPEAIQGAVVSIEEFNRSVGNNELVKVINIPNESINFVFNGRVTSLYPVSDQFKPYYEFNPGDGPRLMITSQMFDRDGHFITGLQHDWKTKPVSVKELNEKRNNIERKS